MSMTGRVATLTIAASISAVAFTGVTATLASAAPSAQARPATTFLAQEIGYGSTLAAAERQAIQELHGDFSGCGTPFLISDAGGGTSWSATMGAYCTGYH